MPDLHVNSTQNSIYMTMYTGCPLVLQARQAEHLWVFSVWSLNDPDKQHLLLPVYSSTCLQQSNSRGLTQNHLKPGVLDLKDGP